MPDEKPKLAEASREAMWQEWMDHLVNWCRSLDRRWEAPVFPNEAANRPEYLEDHHAR